MSRRTITKVTLALVVVLIASLSTVRVRQAWGNQQARSSFDSSRHRVAAALNRGARVGLLTGELAQYRQQAHVLNRVPRPAASLFWGSQESFYDRQATAYRVLAGKINAEIEAVSRRTRAEALSALSAVQSAIRRAQSYDVDAASEQSQLAQQKAALLAASTPKAFRQVTASMRSTLTTLDAIVGARARYVSSALASSGNSTAGIQSVADTEISNAKAQLALVGLFSPHASSLDSQLTRAGLAVHSQTTAFNAAVKESLLHGLAAQVAALSAKTIPNKLIVVSTEGQWARMYENGAQVYDTPVTTGGPELPTDKGTFHIYDKISPFVFHSPWPEGSPYYYPPTPIDFWMPFDGAEGLHDASWRSNFGPGSNFAPTDLGTGNYILGTHGCVNLPYDAASFVWNWAPVGTTVIVT